VSNFLFINLTPSNDDSYTVGPLTLATSLKVLGYDCDFYDNINHSNIHLDSAGFYETSMHATLDFDTLPISTKKILLDIFNQITIDTKMIGFCVLSPNIPAVMFFAKFLKEKYPHLLTIFGGPVFFFHERFGLSDLCSRDYVDCYVRGRATEALAEIFKADFNLDSLSHVSGLCYKSENHWHFSPTINQFEVFNPISFEDIRNCEYTNVSFSIGCPYKCTFCTQDSYYKDYILAPVDSCIEILKPLRNKFVYVTDALINANHVWLKNLCQGMINEKLNIKWGSWFRVAEQFRKKEYLELLYDSGCRRINFGFESASGPVLKHMMKYSNEQAIYQIFNNIRELIREGKPMQVGINILVGYPTETEIDFLKTCKFIFFNHDIISFVNSCNTVAIAPNDRLHQILQKNNEIVLYTADNWATAQSDPSVRFDRMDRMKKLIRSLNLNSSCYHDAEKLRQSPKETWATFPDSSQKNNLSQSQL
jgi:radical SAM superfamily enzyme YgiQ (UPF0313 family)